MSEQAFKELEFAIFCIENLALRLHMNPQATYDLLKKKTDLLQTYIVPSYDVLHTQDKDYIMEDIIRALKLKGMSVA